MKIGKKDRMLCLSRYEIMFKVYQKSYNKSCRAKVQLRNKTPKDLHKVFLILSCNNAKADCPDGG